MKFKNTKKTPSRKEETTSTPKEVKDAALKEEIREMVEETVEEVLQEKMDKEEAPVSTPESISATSELLDSATSQPEEKDKVSMPEASKVIPPQGTPVIAPTAVEESTESPLATSEEPSDDAKSDASPATTPVVPVTAPSSDESESGESDGDITETTEERSKKGSLVRLFILILILLLLLGGGYWYLSSQHMLNLPGSFGGKTVTPSATPEATATPTEASVDLSKYNVSVLNGSGVAGEAAKVKDALTTAGYTVSNTGNADSSDVTDTTIAAKSSVEKAYLDKLTKELGKTYVVSSDVKSLDDSASADVVVTLGSNTK